MEPAQLIATDASVRDATMLVPGGTGGREGGGVDGPQIEHARQSHRAQLSASTFAVLHQGWQSS